MRVAIVGVLCAACGGAMRHDVAKLHTDLDKAHQDTLAASRRIDELENRLYLIEDRLDTARVSQERTQIPTLPVVRLSPTPSSSPPPPPSAPAASERPAPSQPHPERLLVVALPDGRDDAGRMSALSLYRKAHEALALGHYDEAAQLLDRFLSKHPDHDYADNALYWLGECRYAEHDYPRAMENFRGVVDRYPNGNKVPDALLKVSYTYAALGQQENAKNALHELIRTYPQTDAALQAQAKLKEGAP